MPRPVKNLKIVNARSEPAKALPKEARPKITRLPISSGLRPTRSPIGPADIAPSRIPMLDHKKATVNAGPGRFHACVSDGTAMQMELTSNPSQICTKPERHDADLQAADALVLQRRLNRRNHDFGHRVLPPDSAGLTQMRAARGYGHTIPVRRESMAGGARGQ
jgi:hypothetical protein